MLHAKDVMTAKVIALRPEMKIVEAAKILLDNHINGAPVVGGDLELLGILCQSDLVAQQKAVSVPSFFSTLDGFIPLGSFKDMDREMEKIAATTVGAAMTPDPLYVTLDASVEDIAGVMVDKGYHTVPVVDDGKVVGVVGKEDILRTLIENK
ncbi:MAG: CBS domain-containing protein [Desulfovibrionaceae bacterium]|nr:CBS domain-containing protein [Desulfovibrionaceae bacterium]MBF0513374.1 CBS domain-containing protein [Desulfovibrionaceae bacterium]